MDWSLVILNTIGGIGLFLMGMRTMSDGLQRVAGDKLRKILNLLTSNRFMGIFVGASLTVAVQSSSATTVMTIGFVNAGLMSLTQAIGVIFGANIGTTITGWIVILPIVKYSLIIIGIGVFFTFLTKWEKLKDTGYVLFGLGLLFLGMQLMSQGMGPLKQSPQIISLMSTIDGHEIWVILAGILVGTLTTMLFQSSSVTIGLAIAISTNGLINYYGAVSLILGDNIGTTITALLASIGASRNAKRAAIAHTLFNVLAVIIITIFFKPFAQLVNAFIPQDPDFIITTAEQALQYKMAIGSKPYIGGHIAAAHTLFNITGVVLFTGFIPHIARLCQLIIPVSEKEKQNQEAFTFQYLNKGLLATPALAVVESRKELAVMSELVSKYAQRVEKLIRQDDGGAQNAEKISKTEKKINNYQEHISEFLVSLLQNPLSRQDSQLAGNYISLARNLDSISGHIETICSRMEKLARKKKKLSRDAQQTLREIYDKNLAFLDKGISVLKENSKNDPEAYMDEAADINRKIRKMLREAKFEQFEHLKEYARDSELAVAYTDILNSLDGMRNEAFNICEVVTTRSNA